MSAKVPKNRIEKFEETYCLEVKSGRARINCLYVNKIIYQSIGERGEQWCVNV